MAKSKIEISGLMVRTEGNNIIVEVEVGDEWYQVIKEFAEIHESSVSHIIEPDGIREVIKRGYPFP